MLTFKEFSRVNEERCEAVFHPMTNWSPSDWLTATAGELGELANLIKKKYLRDDVFITEEQIQDEVADTFIYLDLLCTRLGFSLEDVVRKKFEEDSIKNGFCTCLP